MKTILSVLLLSAMALNADSVRVGRGVKYHALQPSGTNAPATLCWRRGVSATSTNAVDCAQCVQSAKRIATLKTKIP